MGTAAGSPLLVLWDIDGTLISGGTVARRAYDAAFRQVAGRGLEHPWQFDGRTELAAATEVLRIHGLEPGDGLLERFLDLIVTELQSRSEELAAEGTALPGAAQALDALATLPGVHQTVLTWEPLPRWPSLKVAVFGREPRLDLRIGAFGGDAYERIDLPAHAFRRSEQHLGRAFDGGDTVIVGAPPRGTWPPPARPAPGPSAWPPASTAPRSWPPPARTSSSPTRRHRPRPAGDHRTGACGMTAVSGREALEQVHEVLAGNRYPGRGVLLARTLDGSWCAGYFLAGRSAASRARSLRRDSGAGTGGVGAAGVEELIVAPVSASDHDPLRHYAAVRERRDGWLVYGNGEQVAEVAELLDAGRTPVEAMAGLA